MTSRPLQFRRGFTLIEVVIAAALLGFSLLVMFGFHSQAVRSNLQARQVTDCTYLAQARMERLMTLWWDGTRRSADLLDNQDDPTDAANPWAFLEHPNNGLEPAAVNAANTNIAALGPVQYFVTWDVDDMDPPDTTWARIRVRCQFRNEAANRWDGITISGYRFRGFPP